MHGQLSPRSDCSKTTNCYVFGTPAASQPADHTACKSEHKSHQHHHHLNDDRKNKIQNQQQKLVSNLHQEFNNSKVSRTEKAMNDYLNLSTSNNTSNSSTNSMADSDLTAKLAAATQDKLEQAQEVVDKVNNNTPDESNVERKSQFNCLPSRATNFQNEASLDSTEQITITNQINQMRSLSIQAPDCPFERVQFYKWFASIVRRCRKGGIQNMDSKQFLQNNNHSKYGGFIELVYKQELRDLIWLEIKAWMDTR